MFNKIVGLFLVASCFACNTNNALNKPVLIKFNKDSTKIILSNLPKSMVQAFNSSTNFAGKNLLVVLETPKADDSLTVEKQVNGSIALRDASLFFTPAQSFQKGKAYLVQINLSTIPTNKIDLLKGEIGVKNDRQQQVLSK